MSVMLRGRTGEDKERLSFARLLESGEDGEFAGVTIF